MNVSALSLAYSLLPRASGGIDVASLFGGGAASFSAANAHIALKQAEADKAKQLEQAAKDPAVQRELARYRRVVEDAESVDDVLDDPVARRVLLTANGLGDQADYVGLVKKAVMSDPADQKSLAYRMSETNPAWLAFATKYNLQLYGVGKLKLSAAIAEVSENYIAEKRLDALDQQIPGLGSAVLFKTLAPQIDTTMKVLGNGLAREVVTVALNIPKEIAYQSLEAQERAIERRLDVADLQNPEFVDRLVYRYLVEYNGAGLGGLFV
ncbi:MAG: DUF1217 domain-containing protein [Hydrogenophilaceae bacterium]|jgi:hypothetical protein|nr:DUF1217 domain-containing protein [Hydrogenophilaceae bacterium]